MSLPGSPGGCGAHPSRRRLQRIARCPRCSLSPAAVGTGPGVQDSRVAPQGCSPSPGGARSPGGWGQLGLLAVLLAPAPRVERGQLPETGPPAPQVGEVLL